jgi:hypothetical protein
MMCLKREYSAAAGGKRRFTPPRNDYLMRQPLSKGLCKKIKGAVGIPPQPAPQFISLNHSFSTG